MQRPESPRVNRLSGPEAVYSPARDGPAFSPSRSTRRSLEEMQKAGVSESPGRPGGDLGLRGPPSGWNATCGRDVAASTAAADRVQRSRELGQASLAASERLLSPQATAPAPQRQRQPSAAAGAPRHRQRDSSPTARAVALARAAKAATFPRARAAKAAAAAAAAPTAAATPTAAAAAAVAPAGRPAAAVAPPGRPRYLMCRNAKCSHLAHEAAEFDGYCCKKCNAWQKYKKGTAHGIKCDKLKPTQAMSSGFICEKEGSQLRRATGWRCQKPQLAWAWADRFAVSDREMSWCLSDRCAVSERLCALGLVAWTFSDR